MKELPLASPATASMYVSDENSSGHVFSLATATQDKCNVKRNNL